MDPCSVVFLERVQSYAALPISHIKHLGSVYHFDDSPNAELRWRFYEVALLDPLSEAAKEFAPLAANWVVGNDESGIVRGRMKFCRPTFRAIARANKEIAIAVYSKWKEAFHPIARRLIEKVRLRTSLIRSSQLTITSRTLASQHNFYVYWYLL